MSHPNTQLGWKAELNLSFEKAGNKIVLAKRSQSGPLTVQRPFYPEDDVCHLYILHPPGGVVGGDELHINADLKNKASVLITTPGATKFYRSKNLKDGGKLAYQIQTLKVADGCALEWFPQENIFFDETHTHLSTRVELEKSARFMGWEINCYGRPASKELFESGKVMTHLEIYRDGAPLLLDRLLIEDVDALQSPASMNGYPCFGTFIATHVTQDLLEKARASVEKFTEQEQQQLGLTLMDDLLIVRCLGQHAEQVSTTLKTVWSALRPNVMKRSICLPRIWAT
ncbi:MAG: urease accessory protein UreD [Cocleimonas sp.]|nr:urease accessory protein UreD [Cocleimonas sp.]